MHLLVGQLTQEGSAAPPPSLFLAGLAWRCPRCGRGKLYDGWLTVADRCGECGLNLSMHEKGDGPAFFVIVVLGALVCLLAAMVELTYQPPYLVHAMLWLPLTVIGGLWGLRTAKAWIVAIHYKSQSEDFTDDA